MSPRPAWLDIYRDNDSHAKNLSLYWLPDGRVVLTPFYDLMDTRLYPGLSGEFAFAIGGETRPGGIGREQLAALAAELRMQPRFVLAQAAQVAAAVPAAFDRAIAEFTPLLSPGGRTLAGRLREHVLSMTEKLASRLSPSPAAAA